MIKLFVREKDFISKHYTFFNFFVLLNVFDGRVGLLGMLF